MSPPSLNVFNNFVIFSDLQIILFYPASTFQEIQPTSHITIQGKIFKHKNIFKLKNYRDNGKGKIQPNMKNNKKFNYSFLVAELVYNALYKGNVITSAAFEVRQFKSLVKIPFTYAHLFYTLFCLPDCRSYLKVINISF